MKLTNKDVQINIHEVKRPELDAQLVAANVAHQIEGKIAYRRAVKMTPSVPTLTTHSCPHTPRLVSSVSRFGSAVVRSMARRIWLLTLPATQANAVVAVAASVESAASVVVSAVARETTIVKPSHNQ